MRFTIRPLAAIAMCVCTLGAIGQQRYDGLDHWKTGEMGGRDYFLADPGAHLQTAGATLSGTITDSSGRPIPNAEISIRNAKTGESSHAQANASGVYSVSGLEPGNYAVSVSAHGFAAKTDRVTVADGTANTADLVLQAVQSQAELPSAPQPASQTNLQNVPSLEGLGFSANQIQGNPQEQARLNKRTHMLKVHQTLGLLTLIPMTATVFSGGSIQSNHGPNGTSGGPSSATLDTHLALGSTTGVMYAATAYYAIFAPKIPGTKPTGAIRLHRDLAWIHAPGMLLTGILGIDAYKQEVAGERIHGFASAHGAVAGVTLGAYAASIIAVSWPIHLKFWEKK